MSKEFYIINDFPLFIDTTRALVFNSFGKSKDSPVTEIGLDTVSEKEQEEFNTILSHSESMLIAKEVLKKQTNKKGDKHRYIVTEESYAELIDALNNRMVANIMSSLVSKGLVETSFDNEANDFVFWVKNEDTQKDNPETD